MTMDAMIRQLVEMDDKCGDGVMMDVMMDD